MLLVDTQCTLNSVESYLTTQAPAEGRTSGAINYGTWESLIYGLAHYNELPALRKKLYPERLPTFKPKLLPR
ncbi:jg15563 [Pararge aegeria aegeria]|uniref:Jg15563 protein n=1 Tax=Pararge aegeria aegeria TaxID=348720 RepID=A0A8S4RU01_9NEOP|nr:jg15563 [Pararge aegeria aegeria]